MSMCEQYPLCYPSLRRLKKSWRTVLSQNYLRDFFRLVTFLGTTNTFLLLHGSVLGLAGTLCICAMLMIARLGHDYFILRTLKLLMPLSLTFDSPLSRTSL